MSDCIHTYLLIHSPSEYKRGNTSDIYSHKYNITEQEEEEKHLRILGIVSSLLLILILDTYMGSYLLNNPLND